MSKIVKIELDSGKINLSDKQIKVWNAFSELSPEEFYKELAQDLPKETKLYLELSEQGELQNINHIYTKGKNKGFNFYRVFEEDNRAFHAKASVKNMFNEDVAKIVNRNLFNFYLKSEIKNADIDAEDIGVYAWARAGFIPDDKSWDNIKYIIEERLDFLEEHPSLEDGQLPYDVVDNIRSVIKSDDPKGYWDIVDQDYLYYDMPLGKILTLPLLRLPDELLDTAEAEDVFREKLDWKGSFEVKEKSASIKRFNSYIGSCIKPVTSKKSNKVSNRRYNKLGL